MRVINNQEGLYKRYEKSMSLAWQKSEQNILTLDEAAALIELDTESVPNIIEIYQALSNKRSWLVYSFYHRLAQRFPAETSVWEITSKNYDFLASRVQFLEYYSFEVFNRLAESPRAEHRIMAIKACDELTLEKLSNDKSVKVRREAFAKIGPKALDRMLVDPKCEVRELGVMMAPINYPKLSEMTDDLSIRVVKHLAKKIDVDELPFILGNRNFSKNVEIRQTIEKRLSAFGDKDGE